MGRKARFAIEATMVLLAVLVAAWAVAADPRWFERHVAPRYCIDRPVGAWHLVRAAAIGFSLVLAFLVRPWLGRVVARTRGRDLAATLVGSALAVVAALGLGELMLRHVKWDDAIVGPGIPDVQADPRLGWKLRPNRILRVDRGHAGASVSYAVNARGERAAHVEDLPDPAAPTLVVAGESIAMGYGLDWDDTFAARVGRALGLQVVNLGAPAYGNDQAYLRLLEALPQLSQVRLVVIVFVPVQIRRNISPSRPHLVVAADGTLAPAPAATGLAAWRLGRLVHDEPYHGDDAVAVTRAILLATAQAVRAHGAEALFLITNYGAACLDPEPPAQEQLFAGLPHVRVDLDGTDMFSARDQHPTARGARKLADAILGAAAHK
jgi:hypothetical protein